MKKVLKGGIFNRIFFIVAISVLIVAIVGGAVAKYVQDRGSENLIYSPLFYFTSDLLKEGGEEYVFSQETENISFTIGNNEDELRISEVDINYLIQVEISGEGDTTPPIIKIDGVAATSSKLMAGHTPAIHKVTLEGMKPGMTYTVTVTGTAGYSKTLSAKFTRSNNTAIFYKYLDVSKHPDYVLLTVYTENLTGPVNIAYTGKGLIPDNSYNKFLKDINNYSDISGEFEAFQFDDDESYHIVAGSSLTYKFFIDRTKGDDYYNDLINLNNFVVTLNNGTLYTAVESPVPLI